MLVSHDTTFVCHCHHTLTIVIPYYFRVLEKALQLTLRAIQLFEQECEDKKTEAESEDEGTETPFLSSGARMYYLAGGILLGMKRYEDAIAHLEKAASSCSKWEGLHTSIRRMLVECFSHNMPPAPPDVPSEVADARMLDILFQAGLPLSNLTAIIDSYCSERGIDSLKWNVESTSDSDTSTPFSFSVTFPDSTHATAGDVVAADVTIKSNLAYPSLIKSVALKSVTGEIVVPLSDLMGAQSTKKGIDGVMLAQMESVQFSTDISLPRDLDKIPSDVGSSANAVPSARPRTAGITSAGKLPFDYVSFAPNLSLTYFLLYSWCSTCPRRQLWDRGSQWTMEQDISRWKTASL